MGPNILGLTVWVDCCCYEWLGTFFFQVDGAEAASTVLENDLEKSDIETLLGAAMMSSDTGNESNVLKDSSEMETEVTMEEGSIKVEENEGQIVTVKSKDKSKVWI